MKRNLRLLALGSFARLAMPAHAGKHSAAAGNIDKTAVAAEPVVVEHVVDDHAALVKSVTGAVKVVRQQTTVDVIGRSTLQVSDSLVGQENGGAKYSPPATLPHSRHTGERRDPVRPRSSRVTVSQLDRPSAVDSRWDDPRLIGE